MSDDERLDYDPSSGSGSYDEKKRDSEHPTVERAVGDVGETTFDPTDASPDKRVRFKQLEKRHHEHWNYSGSDETDTNIAYDTRLVCNRLEMTDLQRERVIRLVNHHRKDGGCRYETTIMAVCTFVLNQDGRWIQRDDDEFGDDLTDVYYELIESFAIDYDDVKRQKAAISKAQNDSG